MAVGDTSAERVLLGELRSRRAELRQAISGLEQALAGPARDGSGHWADHVRSATRRLSADFAQHVEITEGPEGLYQELRLAAPRLSGPVEDLTRDHARIRAHVDGLLVLLARAGADGDAQRVRELGTALIGALLRHRQRGADLVYEAYDVDLGGET